MTTQLQHELPTRPGFYRRMFPTNTARGREAACTVYVFDSEDLGGLFFQFVGQTAEGNSLPIPVSLFETSNSRPWLGPFETREEAEASEAK